MAPSKLKAGFVVWPNLLTTLIMSIMASYLTGAWELSITHAAAIVNLYSGVVCIMPVGMICIVCMTGYTGSYWMILLPRFAFTAGLVLLAMSTPPVLAGATGTCSAYKSISSKGPKGRARGGKPKMVFPQQKSDRARSGVQ
ncbi:unnamed protein product [Prunus armeniaca]